MLKELKADDKEKGRVMPDEYKRKKNDQRMLDNTKVSTIFEMT